MYRCAGYLILGKSIFAIRKAQFLGHARKHVHSLHFNSRCAQLQIEIHESVCMWRHYGIRNNDNFHVR